MGEIIVTDSFLGLERDIRNCQNIETFNDCITRQYNEKLLQQCGCLPLHLGNLEKDVLCVSKKDIECSQAIGPPNSTFCLRPCSGLVVSGYSKRQIDKSLGTLMPATVHQYKKFKKMYTVDEIGDFKDYDSELKLRFVRIYFYATTFDQI